MRTSGVPGPGSVIAAKLQIERVLAESATTTVAVARHLALGERVVVKTRRRTGRDDEVRRFLAEAQLAARLRGPHVCRVMDLGVDDGAPYFVMEYLDGRDLAAEVAARGPLPVDEVVELVFQVCDALAEAHALGVVHRDIKPDNLLLTRRYDGSPLVKVLDFGISKQRGAPITGDREVLGTPEFMAPEQWTDARRATTRADIYALGATMHYLLTGRPPIEADSIPELFARIATEEPPPLRTLRPEVPPAIEALVLRCLAREPRGRPADVVDVGDALLPFASAERRAATSGGASPVRPARRARWAVLGGAVVTTLGATFAGVLALRAMATRAAAMPGAPAALIEAAPDATSPAASADPRREVAPDATTPAASAEPRHEGAPDATTPAASAPEPRLRTRPSGSARVSAARAPSPAARRAAAGSDRAGSSPAPADPAGKAPMATPAPPTSPPRCALDDVDCQLAEGGE